MKTHALRQQKRVLAARVKHGLASPAEQRKLNYTRRILEFRREVFMAADHAMGDPTP